MADIRSGVKILRGIVVRAAAVVVVTSVLTAGALSLRAAALSHLGLIAKAPAVEFEIRMPPMATGPELKREAQVELLTDLNQALARLDNTLRSTDDGLAVLRGSVPLKFRTSDRMVVLSLPGQAQRAFKLRLPPNPTPSNEFGPWHLVDRAVPTGRSTMARGVPDDSFAIRYRVL